MKKFSIFILAAAAVLSGCKSTGHIDPGVIGRVDVGMTRPQVITAIGRPESEGAEANTETMYYVEERPWWQWVRVQVKLVDGKVVSYGEAPH
jgi:outer membrane protein assembly factor BamE (lipoprotein component of BamABCDE complex)